MRRLVGKTTRCLDNLKTRWSKQDYVSWLLMGKTITWNSYSMLPIPTTFHCSGMHFLLEKRNLKHIMCFCPVALGYGWYHWWRNTRAKQWLLQKELEDHLLLCGRQGAERLHSTNLVQHILYLASQQRGGEASSVRQQRKAQSGSGSRETICRYLRLGHKPLINHC